ncbi:MAG TPA: zinc dependent phospholipase C family protein [Candidatus Angelobacter sp.]|nr:zinc dependent phospholipase C family protein [Candidatus Angelobacter sp.]
MPKSILGFLTALLLICGTSPACRGYSILTHEEIVDLLWAGEIKPLLMAKYPQASEEDLRKAHAYAYGGCLIQDMGYYPFGNKVFSDMVHYVRSGDFVQALLDESTDINEYAFALGALAHYVSDTVGHPVVNASVAREFPKLRAKYGPSVTYAEDHKAHIRTEFGFDVVQVAKQRYTSDSYHDFIGFEVAKPVLQRAFLKTYGIKLEDIFTNLDLSIGSFRWAVSRAIPEMTKVALLTKKDELVRENPSFQKKKFLYNLKRSDYEREWGKNYHKPGFGAKLLAVIFKIIPKIGPFRNIDFKMPYPDTETLYLKSVNDTVDRYKACLRVLDSKDNLALVNRDFDTGKLTRSGEYSLADETYGKLLDKLADTKFVGISPDLRKDILTYYQDPNAPNTTKKKRDRWNKTMAELEQLKATQVAAIPLDSSLLWLCF